eukprot:m.32750 g.32750  ORF g.32750 m.32750 type:complete len:104 (-) comp12758_c0_seq1:33-344(-)
MSKNLLDTFKSRKPVAARGKAKRSEVIEVLDDAAELSLRTSDLQTLRAFDLDSRFGPCAGLTRLERWERAEEDGLRPPARVLQLVQSHPRDSDYTECIWFNRI